MNKLFVGLLVVVVGGVIGWYYFKGNAGVKTTVLPTPTTAVNPTVDQIQPSTGSGESGSMVTATSTVTYSDTGFSPKTLTVKKGTTVTFENQSSGKMWVASGVHPTHLLLPGFDELKSVEKSGTYQYTFVKVGTWQYHNHVKPSDLAVVVVTE